MILAEYISELLYRYECVIVPGFGGFITNSQPARISSYSNTFYPPTKRLTFNTHLKNNDGLLANYIASVDKMPFKSAMNFIKFEVKQWKEELAHSDVFLDKIGKLSLEDDKILFEPQKQVNYLTDSYGLGTVVSSEIKREEYKKQVEEIEEKAPILVTEPHKERPNYLKYAAIIVLGLSLLGFGGYELYKDYTFKQEVVTAKKQQKAIEQKVQQATFIISDPLPSIVIDATRTTYPFHVIAGAFRFPENADRMVKILKDEGFDSARILGINQWGLTQVSFDSFDSRYEALKALYALRKTMNEDAWLLVQDL
ncbi:MAG: HU-CCDC81 and SPOR domain-containing protein [Flavobacteriaceae bacterium]|nr:HU-CCDC81 and SPOR domain-containing protein [Flavobacteriaceae bacterium]